MQQFETRDSTYPHGPLLQLAHGALHTQILCAAAQLGLAARLAQEDGPVTANDLAPALGVDAVILERILRALVSMNVCDELEGSRFRLTALGEYLRPDHPDSLEARVLLNGQVLHRLWSEMIETMRTGEGGTKRVLGMPFFEYLMKDPHAASLFDRTMAGEVRYRHRPAADAYDFGQFGTLVDVGGGNGALMAEILKAYLQPIGIIFDMPRSAAIAQETINTCGLGDRCRFVGGDAFERVPGGADAYVLSNFVISWGDDQAVIPLRNCRKAVGGDGKVLLVEWVMPVGGEPCEPFRFWDVTRVDLALFAQSGSGGGRVRTRSGFRELLAAAGFEMTAVIPTSGSVSVIEARPV
jgi:SAM-dependent methyltransferase